MAASTLVLPKSPFSRHTFWHEIAGKAQVCNIVTLYNTVNASSLTRLADILTWNRAIVNGTYYTCAFPAKTNQNIYCERLIPGYVWHLNGAEPSLMVLVTPKHFLLCPDVVGLGYHSHYCENLTWNLISPLSIAAIFLFLYSSPALLEGYNVQFVRGADSTLCYF